jgi:hypothetical protein
MDTGIREIRATTMASETVDSVDTREINGDSVIASFRKALNELKRHMLRRAEFPRSRPAIGRRYKVHQEGRAKEAGLERIVLETDVEELEEVAPHLQAGLAYIAEALGVDTGH